MSIKLGYNIFYLQFKDYCPLYIKKILASGSPSLKRLKNAKYPLKY